MRRYLLPTTTVLTVIALLALLVFGVARQGTTSSLDALVARGHLPPLPSAAVALPNLGRSGTTTLASLRGRVILLNVFASWCEPCKAEVPVLADAQRRLAARGGTVIGVTYEDDSTAAAGFVRAEHVDYPVVRDVDGKFVRSLGTTGVPESFLIDRDGRIAALRRFPLDGRWLNGALSRVLAASGA